MTTDDHDLYETDADYIRAWQQWVVYQRTTGCYVQPVNDLSMFYAQRPYIAHRGWRSEDGVLLE